MYFILHGLQIMSYITLRLVRENTSLMVYSPLGNVTDGVRSTCSQVLQRGMEQALVPNWDEGEDDSSCSLLWTKS